MIYQRLLFARTHTVDYRWMIVPTFFTAADQTRVEQVVWSEEIRRTYFQAIKRPRTALFPLFLLRSPSAYVLARFRRTGQLDQGNRPIDCIEGIAVAPVHAWHLRFALSWLLAEFAGLLEVWDTVTWASADAVNRVPAESLRFSLGAIENLPYEFAPIEAPIAQAEKHNLSFDRQGYHLLCDRIFPDAMVRTISLLQFAFGADLQACARLHSQGFDIIVPISGVYKPPPIATPMTSVPAQSIDQEQAPLVDFNQRVQQIKQASKRG